MLEEEGRRIASNPMTPLGRLRRWLREIVALEEPHLPDDYNQLTPLIRLVKSTARSLLEDTELLSPQTPIHLIKPSKRTLDRITHACLFSKRISKNGLCWLTTPRSTTELVNELSALVHHYEAIAFSRKISHLVRISEDAEERFVKLALQWEKNVITLKKHGLIGPEPDELFALATKRLDLKIGLSPGHLTKIGRTTAEYFDPDLDAVYSLGELHLRHGGRLMAKTDNYTYLFSNPAGIPEVWAVAVSQDRRNLLFRRLFHDVIKRKPTSLLKAYSLAEEAVLSYSPEFERRELHRLLLQQEDVLETCIEEIAYGVISAMKNPDDRRQIEDFSVGRAGGVASDLIIHEVLGG